MSRCSHPEVVRRARSLIDARAGEPVSVAELHRAAGVSERTLRNAFHDVYGMSPKQFQIRQGLVHAHRALRLARNVRGGVTHVATEHGFFELGRFAAAYRRLFGECPSETLRGAPARADYAPRVAGSA